MDNKETHFTHFTLDFSLQKYRLTHLMPIKNEKQTCTCNRPENWDECIPCNSCNVSYYLTCLNLASIPSGQFW